MKGIVFPYLQKFFQKVFVDRAFSLYRVLCRKEKYILRTIPEKKRKSQRKVIAYAAIEKDRKGS